MKARMYCEKCDKEYMTEIEFISDITWECEFCKSDRTWVREFIYDEPQTEFKLNGRGGCGKPK
jgi:hypothetical protein